MELVKCIRLGYDNIRYYMWIDDVKIVAQGWVHDSDFAIIERIHEQHPLLQIFCNEIDITHAI